MRMDPNRTLQSTGTSFSSESQLPSWLHCNGCGRQDNNAGGYLLAPACGHIYCQSCVGRLGGCENLVCPLCKKQSSMIPLDKRMPPQCAIFFSDPIKILKRCIGQVESVTNYQMGQAKLLLQRKDFQLQRYARQVKIGTSIIDQRDREIETLKLRVANLEHRFKQERELVAKREMDSTFGSQRTDDSRRSTQSLSDRFADLLRRPTSKSTSAEQPRRSVSKSTPTELVRRPVPKSTPTAPRKRWLTK